ncbi:hypothetical protein DSO57_1001611 [Entomophthora muscae]|uniref:Uncharacterized protein n=1 Tax=Entomophthora muscae TaxID=34485 RepID=A0ACC2S049_9FUNG|nr:hypothetical protein DSO57_1001611 [Entomophthora muscae]
MEPPTAAKTTSTQLFGVLYIPLTGMVDSIVLNSGPWSLLEQSVSYIIKLAPILWWALPTDTAVPQLETPNASPYAWFPKMYRNVKGWTPVLRKKAWCMYALTAYAPERWGWIALASDYWPYMPDWVCVTYVLKGWKA